MMCFPEVQKRAQAEIDLIVGCDRLPVLADRKHLPYVHALCLELLRWNPVAPLGTSPYQCRYLQLTEGPRSSHPSRHESGRCLCWILPSEGHSRHGERLVSLEWGEPPSECN